MNDSQDIQQLTPGLINALCPLTGVATAGQPTAEHLTRLAAAGYRTVLDLCTPEEARPFDEAATATAAGLDYVNVPVYSQAVDEAAFDQVRALLRDPGRRPMLFHCRSANRVGALLIPYLILDEGRTAEEAVTVATAVGLRSPELAQAAFQYPSSMSSASKNRRPERSPVLAGTVRTARPVSLPRPAWRVRG